MTFSVAAIGSSSEFQAMSGASASMPPVQKMTSLYNQIDTSGTGSITQDQFNQTGSVSTFVRCALLRARQLRPPLAQEIDHTKTIEASNQIQAHRNRICTIAFVNARLLLTVQFCPFDKARRLPSAERC
jgi:hypothetical protein